MKFFSPRVAAVIGAVLMTSAAYSGTPFPTKSTPAPVDAGDAAAGGAPLTLTLPLKLRDPQGAEALLRAMSDKGSASYHQFLTPAQFRAQFGPSDDDVAAVVVRTSGHTA